MLARTVNPKKGTRKARRKLRARPEPRIPIVPSAAIEARVELESRRAIAIAGSLTELDPLGSGYLVSAIYYHDGLLDRFNPNDPKADPADRIVATVARQMPQNTKREWVRKLGDRFALEHSEMDGGRLRIPVAYEPLGHSKFVHPYAIDLFVNEGTPVRSATAGIVVLAEGGWKPLEWFSTSSVRGGNAVIVFHPLRYRFYRYAHLESIRVSAGDSVEAGDVIGAVGHTGFNAARKGHGRHVHFEINEFDPRTGLVSAIAHDDLEALLEAARVPAQRLVTPTGATSPESGLSISRRSAPE